MKRKATWIFLLLALALSACSLAPSEAAHTIPAALPQTEEDVPRVSVEEAKAAFESGQALIVDVRGVDYYAASHIAGALSIPLSRIEDDPADVSLDKTKWIITYCA
jgi:3-mercaptopyruvate sulfurtransferase SseA